MLFLTPRHVKFGRNYAKDARKLLAYRRDLLEEKTVREFEEVIGRLEAATKSADKKAIEDAAHAVDEHCGKFMKRPADAAWRENCEVFLVAIVIALGVRTYFLQPFTIPTGSMQPTLNGILATKTATPPPNALVRTAQFALWGRTWVDVVSKTDDVFLELRAIKKFGVLSRTAVVCQRNTYVVDCPADTLRYHLMEPFQEFKAGQVIARGYWDTGDHVFVDKMSYHFFPPQRGNVFVFNTQNIPTRENNHQKDWKGPSQYYIKRLAGLPGDTLQIRPPELLVNGQRASGFGFERVMAAKDGYRGYSNASEQTTIDGQSVYVRMNLLGNPQETFKLGEDEYFALGDNSFHSSDSRDWGSVPERNLMGRGLFVYWPFTRHFGFIR